ncbi:MAG: patatin-like phospholipase family protein [Desulfococcaceae bacterium]
MTARLMTLRAGAGALNRIRDEGLRPEAVRIVAGAAGGPKFLVLSGLDRFLFGDWFRDRKTPLFLVGASSGAWRFAAAAAGAPEAVERFRRAYMAQTYSPNPGPAEISAMGRKILNRFLGEAEIASILSHPAYRLSVLAVRSRAPVSGADRFSLMAGFAGAAMANLAGRRLLGLFFERVLFFDSRQVPPFARMNGFPLHRLALTRRNLRSALMASGSIPLVMEGVADIPDAPPGVYRDGGVIDYHLDIPFLPPEADGLVLFPHYADRVIPGWLDKKLTWRRPSAANMDKVLLVSPSPEMVRSLPGGRIPDRKDFHRFLGRDMDRFAAWQRAAMAGERMAEEFADLVESGRIREAVEPMAGLAG